MRGFGTLPDLAIAESLDSTLKGDVSDLTSGFAMTTSFADGMALDTSIADILYRWAGVDEDPGDRGGFDAQKREFMEHFFGQACTQYVYRPDPRGDALAELQDAWDAVFYNAKAELLSQLDAGAIFDGTAIYNPYTGNFEGTKDILQGTIDDLQAAAPTDTTAHTQAYWEQVAQIIDVVKGFENLTTGENTMMDDAITATDATLSWNGIEATALPRFFGYVDNSGPDDDTISGTIFGDNIDGGAGNDTISGGSGADTLHGGTGNDLIYGDGDNDTVYGDAGNDELHGGDANDTIYEGDGNDTLYGDAGNDIIDSGAGGNYVYGGNGDDTYVFNGGTDVYEEYYTGTGTDTILMPSGIDAGDLTFARAPDSGLLITIGTLGSVEIADFFQTGGYYILGGIETITFDDTSTLDLSAFTALTTYGSSGDDTIYGLYSSLYGFDVDNTIYGNGGNDTISAYSGTNIIDGGAGNDTINGGDGDDAYIASPGFDNITEGGGGSDVIQMPEGITTDDVHLLRHADVPNDLEITIDGAGQINITSQFYTSSSAVEQIVFSDTSTLDLTTHQIETVGTAGNNSLLKSPSTAASTTSWMAARATIICNPAPATTPISPLPDSTG